MAILSYKLIVMLMANSLLLCCTTVCECEELEYGSSCQCACDDDGKSQASMSGNAPTKCSCDECGSKPEDNNCECACGEKTPGSTECNCEECEDVDILIPHPVEDVSIFLCDCDKAEEVDFCTRCISPQITVCGCKADTNKHCLEVNSANEVECQQSNCPGISACIDSTSTPSEALIGTILGIVIVLLVIVIVIIVILYWRFKLKDRRGRSYNINPVEDQNHSVDNRDPVYSEIPDKPLSDLLPPPRHIRSHQYTPTVSPPTPNPNNGSSTHILDTNTLATAAANTLASTAAGHYEIEEIDGAVHPYKELDANTLTSAGHYEMQEGLGTLHVYNELDTGTMTAAGHCKMQESSGASHAYRELDANTLTSAGHYETGTTTATGHYEMQEVTGAGISAEQDSALPYEKPFDAISKTRQARERTNTDRTEPKTLDQHNGGFKADADSALSDYSKLNTAVPDSDYSKLNTPVTSQHQSDNSRLVVSETRGKTGHIQAQSVHVLSSSSGSSAPHPLTRSSFSEQDPTLDGAEERAYATLEPPKTGDSGQQDHN